MTEKDSRTNPGRRTRPPTPTAGEGRRAWGETRVLKGAAWEALANALPEARRGGPLLVVTDTNVAQALREPVESGLKAAGLDPAFLAVAPGERSHCLERALELVSEVRRLDRKRSGALLALGGGVIADLTGFTAGMLYGGMPWALVPTSLTAQVDPPLEGRVRVSGQGIPGLLGLHWPPLAVLLEPAYLEWLPARQLKSGLGVVLRAAAGRDRALFRYVTSHAEQAADKDPATLAYFVEHALGLRTAAASMGLPPALLRVGEPFAQAFERLDRTRNHGEAAALGLAAVADLSVTLGFLEAAERDEIREGLKRNHLPWEPGKYLNEDLVPLLEWAEPPWRGRVSLAVLERTGHARLEKIHLNDMINLVRGMQ
jgi:3-dehydroquinate synthase